MNQLEENIFQVRNLTKIYKMGEVEVHALRGDNMELYAGEPVVLSGVATFILFISTMHSLDFTRSKFYHEYNFADVFVNLKRAPESLKDKIKNINGVRQLETRVSAYAKLDIQGYAENVTGIAAGIWLGKMMGDLYMEFYRFPAFIYTLHPEVLMIAVSVSVFSALAGPASKIVLQFPPRPPAICSAFLPKWETPYVKISLIR
ncbi:MAG: hypothetical protein WBN66_05200 [Smithella sp.]